MGTWYISPLMLAVTIYIVLFNKTWLFFSKINLKKIYNLSWIVIYFIYLFFLYKETGTIYIKDTAFGAFLHFILAFLVWIVSVYNL